MNPTYYVILKIALITAVPGLLIMVRIHFTDFMFCWNQYNVLRRDGSAAIKIICPDPTVQISDDQREEMYVGELKYMSNKIGRCFFIGLYFLAVLIIVLATLLYM